MSVAVSKRQPVLTALALAVFVVGNVTAIVGMSVERPWITVLGLIAGVVSFWIDDL